ncbi:tyrosine--tRNA ligase [Candidatus Pelagibacter sp.]|nr:tyrosine--tRNA ligase [Candidatus Pelagibacter sp.]MDB3970162.1 tyrosine--tRNA ligase [Candidatus Pelagibacter sp.]MDB4812365.1 tyrosine--tRNA ligase [Candidatus Pelagibacter sp.]MDC0465634.1 tyrosine--tRNA ligase [Candidatus Pelagibacter sp.]
MNKFLKEFKDRGFFYQCTNEEELSSLMDKEKIKAYIGFDCTAESLHVGSLLQIMCLRLLQKNGHRPIVLLGGGTTRIGDPSGKDKTRKILNEEEIEKNIKNIKNILKKFLDNDNPETKPIFVNNYTWLKNLNYISFLRDIGKHFTINRMLTFDSVKLRLDREQSLSYMEFNYMILQAYDFLELSKKENCVLQIGGSDQWGNIVNGVELIKRYSNKQSYGLTTPLITLATGAKMGKSENGAIWLDEKFLSAYDYWQFWRNTDDRDVVKFLKNFTDIEIEDIKKVENNNINDLKILLANKTTSMLHGNEAAKNSQQAAKEAFSGNSLGSSLPSVKVNSQNIDNKLDIIDLIILSKLEKSKSEIRRLIKGNAVKINDKVVSDEKLIIENEFFNENYLKLSIGKKRHIKIELD